MRVLVTGGAGFIGSHIADGCLAVGHDVAVVDNLWQQGGGKKSHVPQPARFYEVDITHTADLQTVFAREQPQIVFHEAAQHTVTFSTKDPIYDAQVNVIGLLNVLQNCVATGVQKIIFASSAATYGDVTALPVTETTPQQPQSPYGITKMVAEHYLRYYAAAHGLRYTALRYGNVYGPRQDAGGEGGVIAVFTSRFITGTSVRIDGTGEQERDFCYVGDVADANIRAITAGDNDIFCIASGSRTSVNQIYRELADLTGVSVPIAAAPKRLGDIDRIYFDCQKAEAGLGWRAHIDIREGLQRTLDFFRTATL